MLEKLQSGVQQIYKKKKLKLKTIKQKKIIFSCNYLTQYFKVQGHRVYFKIK
jgi:hypothetical protein